LKDVSWLDELVPVSGATMLFQDQRDKGDLTGIYRLQTITGKFHDRN
jgi:hypothetical protein